MGFAKGDKVEWRWGTGTGQGIVAEVFTDKVTRMISPA
jgi:Hypervirulence associated proteins TUDOR domain